MNVAGVREVAAAEALGPRNSACRAAGAGLGGVGGCLAPQAVLSCPGVNVPLAW